MTKDVVMRVENLTKYFKIYAGAKARLKEWFSFGKRSYHKNFLALNDVSFEVYKGSFLGIIGPNGAGKSTLLKLITGVLEPTSGTYKITGKVLSLLELSGGMDNDLTGRENIIRSSQLLGFPDGYVEARMDQIADFAELGDFFDQPLGTYSSGMRIRLAFSMFAFLECDVLILDEVLAVGDIFFRQKCYARLEELIAQNVAIVLVTHSTGTVRRYCDDVIVLDKGHIVFHGQADDAIQKYFQIKKSFGVQLTIEDTFVEEDYLSEADTLILLASQNFYWPPEEIFNDSPLPETADSDTVTLTHLAVCDERGKPRQIFKPGEKVNFYFAYTVKKYMGVPVTRLGFKTVHNILVHNKSSLQHNANVPLQIRKGDRLQFKQIVQLDIAPGKYIFELELFALHPDNYAQVNRLSTEEVKEVLVPVHKTKAAGVIEVIPEGNNKFLASHGGLCNLPGEFYVHLLSETGIVSTDS